MSVQSSRSVTSSSSRFRRAKSLFLVLALSSLQIGCLTIQGSGNIEKLSPQVDAYDSIYVSDSFEAEIVMGDEYEVIIRADDNLIDDVVFHQNGNRVEVSLPDTSFHNATLEVTFVLPELAAVHVDDSSWLEASSLVLADTISISVDDSSHLELSADKNEFVDELDIVCDNSSHCEVGVSAESAIVEVNDSSHLRLKGEAEALDLSCNNSSSLKAEDFVTADARVSVNDSSSASIRASASVKGSVNNSSSLTVRGGADVDVSVRDSSSVNEK